MFLDSPRSCATLILCKFKQKLQKWRNENDGVWKNVSGLILKEMTEAHNTKSVHIPHALFKEQVI